MPRIALLSFAHVHAHGYAQQVRDHKDAEIACIWDDDPARGKPAAEQYGVPYFSDLSKVLSDGSIDGVVVNAPTSQHPQVIGAAVEAGKNVFTEKALTVTTADSNRLVEAVRRKGIKFMISLPSRTNPEVLFLKKVVDDGLIGKVTLMRARIAHCAALDSWFHDGSAWFGDEKLAGGGALFDLGCHTVDVMRWILGEPASVIAKVNNYSGAYDIDDNSAAVVEFKNKALGILDVSWVHRAGPNTMELYGTEGFVGKGYPGGGIVLQSKKALADGLEGTVHPSNLPKPPATPMNQWVASMVEDAPMTITVEDGRNLTELLEGIYTSSREGRSVGFPIA
ncbi:MAG TPA: Gfo/Idh/MocA family oxidoreductase [Armatimonadota bacterium]|jgi:predicted dehydrogenase